jgi:hypothetical protein
MQSKAQQTSAAATAAYERTSNIISSLLFIVVVFFFLLLNKTTHSQQRTSKMSTCQLATTFVIGLFCIFILYKWELMIVPMKDSSLYCYFYTSKRRIAITHERAHVPMRLGDKKTETITGCLPTSQPASISHKSLAHALNK